MFGVSTTLRRGGGSLALAFVLLATVGCDVHVGWSAEYDESLSGRTPANFAAACGDIAGTLVEEQGAPGANAKSSCTMPNGDAITCDWQEERCITACQSSEQECARVRDLAYVPILRRTPAPATVDSATSSQDLATPNAHGSASRET